MDSNNSGLKSIFDKKTTTRVVFVYPDNQAHIAEDMMVKNMQYVLRKNNIDSYVYRSSKGLKQALSLLAQRILSYLIKPDFQIVILNCPHIKIFPTFYFVNQFGALNCKILKDKDALLNINEKHNWIEEILNKCNLSDIPIRILMPSLPVDFCTPAEKTKFNKIFASLRLDEKSDKYREICLKLQSKNYINIYGRNPGIEFEKSYKKMITNPNEILHELHDCGIALVIHRDNHIKNGFTSGRLFEAIAAGSAIICDSNTYVKEHFGDNIFYFDHNKSAEEMTNQIESHYLWIKKHPEEARKKIINCQKIWMQFFSMDHFVHEIISLYFTISNNKSNKKT